LEERVTFYKYRIPIGSQLNVFVNNIDQYGMILTLAFKSNPLLNYPQDNEENAMIKGKSNTHYLIILDLEATCDFSPEPIVDDKNSEIIEFPWIVLNTETLEIIYENQIYVKPDDIKGITPYCRVLTGITEDKVEKSGSLLVAIEEFERYLATLPKGSYCIVTDGVWDLKQLQIEAKRKNIILGEWCNCYHNLKQEFKQFLPLFPWREFEPPLHIMLQAFSLKFVGRAHSGIDDCFSIAQIVKTLLKRGHHFNQTSSISEDNDLAYRKFSSTAPPGSWICKVCTEKHSRPGDSVAVWNKPFAKICRFCFTPQT